MILDDVDLKFDIDFGKLYLFLGSHDDCHEHNINPRLRHLPYFLSFFESLDTLIIIASSSQHYLSLFVRNSTKHDREKLIALSCEYVRYGSRLTVGHILLKQ